MIILSHRGYWTSVTEKNQRIAFERSFNLGFGTETDLRDANGIVVISHDAPQGNAMPFEELLQMMAGRNLPLALNIKADGLVDMILHLLQRYKHTNYFNFDMSIPEMVVQLKKNAKVYTGLSDIQPNPVLLNASQGVWLDAFNGDWYSHSQIDDIIDNGKSVCIVSADLHRRDHAQQWATIKQCKHIRSPQLSLCTDYPVLAQEYFKC